VPNEFHQIPRLIRDFMEVDVTITTVSPMDQAGFFSFGTVNDYISTAARHGKQLIVEVNPQMPRVFGDSLLHVSEVDAIVENDVPLLEVMPAPPKPEAETVGRLIAEMIPDGATLQLGIGGIPNAVCRYLDGHKDLGIHTELMCPGMVHLIKKGAITGRLKTLHPRKHVFTNAIGDREMYEFMHDNPSMESYPVSYTNAPEIIAQNDRMISITSGGRSTPGKANPSSLSMPRPITARSPGWCPALQAARWSPPPGWTPTTWPLNTGWST
jgi:itaconate CoA-transferase